MAKLLHKRAKIQLQYVKANERILKKKLGYHAVYYIDTMPRFVRA